MRGKLLEFVFQQPITCDILAVNYTVVYESYNLRLGQFVAYPRAYDKQYILPGDVLVYHRSDVQLCPGAQQLAHCLAPNAVGGGENRNEDSEGKGENEDSDADKGPLPSLISHVASSNYCGSSVDSESVVVTPRRSLRLRQSSASTHATPHSVVSAMSAALSTPQRKRKQVRVAELSPRKRVRTSGTVSSRMELKEDDEIWEVVNKEIAIKMSG